MKRSKATLAVLIAGVGVVGSGIAFLCFSHSAPLPVARQPEPAPVQAEPPVPVDPAFEKSADRVTIGTGRVAPQANAALVEFDGMLRRMAGLPEGEEKVQMAHHIEELTNRAAVPVLLDWATATTDRAVLRASLTALGHLANAEMIEDIEKRYSLTSLYDDRYRLARIIKDITNPEAVPALMELARATDAPAQLVAAATDALASIGTPPAVSLLLQKLEQDQGDGSARLATAIARIDRTEALSTLQFAALGNKDASSTRTRVAAIQALANFTDDQTRQLLTQLRADTTEEVRTAAAAALSQVR